MNPSPTVDAGSQSTSAWPDLPLSQIYRLIISTVSIPSKIFPGMVDVLSTTGFEAKIAAYFRKAEAHASPLLKRERKRHSGRHIYKTD